MEKEEGRFVYEFLEKKKDEQERGKANTGIPVQLKRKMEQSTGVSFEDVRVHYNSDKPEQLDALAYTKGSDVYLGQGQERHLPHELGHVVQQKLGYVHAESRHASGERLNSNPALERQADLIAAGGFRISHRGAAVEEVVQRMSVYEGKEDRLSMRGAERRAGIVSGVRDQAQRRISVDYPLIGRYKREGWIAFRDLKKYFTEASLKRVSMDEIKSVLLRMEELQNSKATSDMDILQVIESGLELNANFKTQIDEYIAERKPEARVKFEEIYSILKKCRILMAEMDQGEGGLLQQVERVGEYERVSDVNPYYNYKKMAMYCIAHLATKIVGEDLWGDAGPHIAITVMGGRIYAANNTSFIPYGQQPVDMRMLRIRIRAALDAMNRPEIIVSVLNGQGRCSVSGAPFEGTGVRGALGEEQIKEIWGWIEKIKKYPIVIIDVPEQRKREAAYSRTRPTHGEMSIMDYLESESMEEREKACARFPKTTHSVLERRHRKLGEIKKGQKKVGMRKVIWFGGTRMDCKKCHEHFAELRDKINGSYVVSSLHTSKNYFDGTKDGTHPRCKMYGGKAHVAELEFDIDYINIVLSLLIERLEYLVSLFGRVEENDIRKDEFRLIDGLNKYLPSIRQSVYAVENEDFKQKCDETMKKVAYITRLYLNMSESDEEQASQAE